MRSAAVFEQKNSLPGSELQFPIDHRDDLARSGERHPNVGRAVVRAFVVVLVIGILRHKALEEIFQITARSRRRVLHDHETATRVPNEHRHSSGGDVTLAEDSLNLVGNFVCSLSVRPHLECFALNRHRRTLTPADFPASFDFAQDSEDWIVSSTMEADLERILFDEATIHHRLDELATQITNDYRGRELTVIAILNGSVILMADLLRRLPIPLKLDCLSVASYHGGSKTTGELVFRQLWMPDIAGRHVLLLDDILDSGVTLGSIREKIQSIHPGPESIRICVLLEKKKTRLRQVDADYVGFQIGDEFVVGYGLDYMEGYRNLPYIGVLRNDLITATA